MEDRYEKMIFVTGYFGAPIHDEAERIASSKGWQVFDLDAAVEEKDGRSIARLCMMNGEHAYRNAEYEQIAQLCESGGQERDSKGARKPAEDRGGAAADCGGLVVDHNELTENHDGSAMDRDGLVVACGDGVLYDDDSRSLILKHELIIAGRDLALDELWERARQNESTYHAFMKFGTEEEKRRAFEEHHKRQKALFDSIAAR